MFMAKMGLAPIAYLEKRHGDHPAGPVRNSSGEHV
jgi:hypothetical protein